MVDTQGLTALIVCSLPGDAELCRTAGNRAYFEKDWSSAIEQYTQGIHLAPDAAALYSHRAGAYLQRKWQGDGWLALQVQSVKPAGGPQTLSVSGTSAAQHFHTS